LVIPLKPTKGGFLRPFGCGWFIREFLSGNGPGESPQIDSNTGAPQADIFYHYKNALRSATAYDRATRVAKKYLARLPYKAQGCRYHSFVVYFSTLQRLGWVEPTGQEESSAFQSNYPPGPPRRYYRLTDTGIAAGDVAWSNPHLTLYGNGW